MPSDPDTPRAPRDAQAPRGPVPGRTEVPFAFLSHPLVQVVRFLTKAALAWFLTTEEFGSAMLVGLFAFLAQHLALFGLDDAVVYAPRLGRGLWRRLRRFLHVSGALLTLLVAGTGLVLGRWLDSPGLGDLAVVLAPTVWIGNLAVLPTALLVREQRFKRVFFVDLWSVVGFALATLLFSMLGAGAWSLIAGWYANALLAALSAHLLARELHPGTDEPEEDERETMRYGAHLTGAGLLSFGAERLDSFAVGLGIGRAVLGLYEWALHVSQPLVQYTANLSERYLFPTLAAERRRGVMSDRFREAVRLTNTFLLPAHIALAVAAPALVTGLFPVEWHAAAPLLSVLALVAAWRCVEVVAIAALKATGASRTVLRLSGIHLGLLAVAVALSYWRGILPLALAVLAARAVAALVALLSASKVTELRAAGAAKPTSAGVPFLLWWCALFLPLAWALAFGLRQMPILHLAGTASAAGASWLLVRWLVDRPALFSDWSRISEYRG